MLRKGIVDVYARGNYANSSLVYFLLTLQPLWEGAFICEGHVIL